MSFVAEAKAAIQKQARVAVRKMSVRTLNPTPKRARAISNCIHKNHRLLVPFKSTQGLQRGLRTQGR